MDSFLLRSRATCVLSLTLLLAGACAHPGPSGFIGGGGIVPPPPPPPPPPPSFTLDDLMGDWVGQLVPDSAGRSIQNVYLRFDSDQLVESADSAGNEWTLVNSDRFFDFSSGGHLNAEIALFVGSSSLTLGVQMNAARIVMSGTYVQVSGDLFPVTGTLQLERSSGAGMYDIATLEGDWSGKIGRAHV